MNTSKHANTQKSFKSAGKITATLPDGTPFSGTLEAYQYANQSRIGFFVAKSGEHRIVVELPKQEFDVEKNYSYPNAASLIAWLYIKNNEYKPVEKGTLKLTIDANGNAKGDFTFTGTGDSPTIKDGTFNITYEAI